MSNARKRPRPTKYAQPKESQSRRQRASRPQRAPQARGPQDARSRGARGPQESRRPRGARPYRPQNRSNAKLARLIVIAVAALLILLALLGVVKCTKGLVGKIKGTGSSSGAESAQVDASAKKQAQNKKQPPLIYETKYGTINTDTYNYDRAMLTGSKNPQKELRAILDEAGTYPTDLIASLSLNPELMSFTYDYHKLKDSTPATDIGKPKIVQNGYPHLLQFDKRWGYMMYGSNVLGLTGCGPTVIAMTVDGLTGRTDVTPAKVAEYALKNNMKSDEGTSWELMSTGCKEFGIEGKQLKSPTKDAITKSLQEGHPVIVSVKAGDFTVLSHFLLITGLTDDGYLMINDPNSVEKTNTLWTFDRLLPQVKVAWSMRKVS